MKRIAVLSCLLTMVATVAFSQAQFDKYWERLCGVKTSVDDVRTMAVWPAGNVFVTIDRNAPATAIPIYNLNSGLPWAQQEYVAMSGASASVPAGLYNIVDGDFTSDGKLIACSLSYLATTPLQVYMWDSLTTGPRVIYSSGVGTWHGYRLGDAVDVAGSTADNSAVVLISGNNAASKPLKLTTADNGLTWTTTDFAGALQCQEIEQVTPGGDFWATRYSSAVPIQRYNSAGVSYGAGPGNQILTTTTVPTTAFAAFALDTAYDRIYTMGVRSATLQANWLRVYQMSTGALVDTFTADPLELLGVASGTLNGSGSCELVVSPGGGHFIYALSERNGVARYIYSTTVTVDKLGTGTLTYATIQGAINDFNAGGGLGDAVGTTVTLPLVIKLDKSVEPFEEAINLDDAIAGKGQIVGDLMIRGSSDADLTRLALKKVTDAGAGTGNDDGMVVHQNSKGVTLKNLLIYPHMNPSGVLDDLLKYDENSANTTMNWHEIWNCVITNTKTDGNPMVTTKAEALVGPPPASGSLMAAGDQLHKAWNDPGESFSLVADNATFYGGPSYANAFIMNGITGEETYINNCLAAWNENTGFEIGFRGTAAGPTHWARVTGDDAGAGPLNCTAAIQNEWHGLYLYTSAFANMGVAKVDNYLCYVDALGDNTAPNDARGISGSTYTDLMLRDSIITARNACVVDGIANAASRPALWERVTLHNNAAAGNNTIFALSPNTSVLTLKDCIVSGLGNKFVPSAGTMNVTLTNCDIVSEGPHAITALGSSAVITSSGLVLVDPLYGDMTDPTLASHMDVSRFALKGKATAGANLVGGADMASVLYEEGANYQLAIGPKASVYDVPATVLDIDIATTDIISGVAGTVTGNGFHPATVPGDATGRALALTNDTFDASGLTVIGADTDGNSQPSFAIEYDFAATSQQATVNQVRVFAGHDGDGARGFINCAVEIDTGSGYAPLATLMTGAFGLAKPNATTAAYADWTGTQYAVQKIRFTFENVSHSSTGYFQAPADNGPPANNYPNQGTVLKEIDVIGSLEPLGAVQDWTLF